MQTIKPVRIEELKSFDLKNKTVMNVPDSSYVKIWDTDYYYCGSINEQGEFNGYGEIVYYNDLKIKSFKGIFVNGIKNGTGCEIYENGDIYHGNFMNDMKLEGILYNVYGVVKYKGLWDNNEIIGKIIGYQYNEKGDKIYYGYMKNNKPEGVGINYKDNKIVRIGEYSDGLLLSSIDFFENKLAAKEIPYDVVIDNLSKLYTILTEEIVDIDELQNYKYLLLNQNSNKIKKFNSDHRLQYEGDILYTNGECILNGSGKYYNYKLNIRFKGNFKNNTFEDGKVSKLKKDLINTENIILKGNFNSISMLDDNTVTLDNIYKSLIDGEIYNNTNVVHNYSNKVFVGSVKNGRPSIGILYIISNNERVVLYEGYFDSSIETSIGTIHMFDGEGTLYINSKTKYHGHFYKGLYSGQGTLYNDNENIEYIGDFLAGEKHGNGMLFDNSSELIYEGIFNYNNIGIN
jgi:hypothetical protein